jgi:hypothetical protein
VNGHDVVFLLYQIVSGIHVSSVQRRLVIKWHSAFTYVEPASGLEKRRGRRRGEAVYDTMISYWVSKE